MTDIFPHASRVCAYIRDSGGKEQDLSTQQQRESIGKWCAENGLILSRVYEDAARSGSTITGRDKFLEMVDYLSRDVQERGVILWEYSRLARDFDDFQYYVSDIRRRGYIVHSLNDNVPQGLDGRLLESVTAWKNAKYLEDLRKNIRRGLHYTVRTYHAHVAKVPAGYLPSPEIIGKRRDGSPHIISHLIIDPTKAPLVKRAFELRARGMTYAEIDGELHLFNQHDHYRRMLNNRIYTGVYVFGEDVITDFCEPIVSTELWNAVQALNVERKSRSGTNHPRAVRSRFWLTGMLFCGVCGKPMIGQTVRNPYGTSYDYYRCGGIMENRSCRAYLIPKDEIEQRVMLSIRDIVNNDSIINNIYEEAQAQQSHVNDSRDSIMRNNQVQIDLVDKQITRLLSAIKDTGHSRAMLHELDELEKRRVELSQSLSQIEIVSLVIPLAPDDIRSLIGQALALADDKQKAIIMRGLVKRIEAQRVNKILTGYITMQPPGLGEIVIAL